MGNQNISSRRRGVVVPRYAQEDIIRFVVNESKGRIKFHLLLFGNGTFRVYHLHKPDVTTKFSCYCHEHAVENIIDGIITAQTKRFTSSSTSSSSSSPPWQLLMDITRDYVHYPCMDNGLDGCLEGNHYPPVVTIAAVPKTSKVLAPFLHQMEIIHYNDCIYHLRRQEPSCWLRDQLDPFTNATDQVWANLTPQIYWRGTNFAFIEDMVPASPCPDVLPPRRLNLTQVAAKMLPRTDLTPRCRAVIMSGQAQEEWQQLAFHATSPRRALQPWLNIKFGGNTDHHKDFQQAGYEAYLDQFVKPRQVADYKYHIDLGGGGGTTWTGTIMKLAMPGLLFHHETLTKDLFHDELQPWIHYVPVNTNLSNLHDLFVWAESHPMQAQRIAQQGQEYARQHVSHRQVLANFEKYYVDQLGELVDAYQPPGKETLGSILQGYEQAGFNMTLIATCKGTQCNWAGRQITTLRRNNRLAPP